MNGSSRQPLEHAVGDRARPADRVELVVVLHRAQALDDAGARHELEPAARAALDWSYGTCADSKAIRPEPLGEIADQRPLRLHDLDARDCRAASM